MKLADLKPEFSRCYESYTPETGGINPLPMVHLKFVCPKCGPGREAAIYITTGDADHSKSRWHCNALPNGPGWPDRLTVTPSLQLPIKQHGVHRPDCGAHFSITNGEII